MSTFIKLSCQFPKISHLSSYDATNITIEIKLHCLYCHCMGQPFSIAKTKNKILNLPKIRKLAIFLAETNTRQSSKCLISTKQHPVKKNLTETKLLQHARLLQTTNKTDLLSKRQERTIVCMRSQHLITSPMVFCRQYRERR